MRVLIAPDSFGGTLTAAEAASALAAGWQQGRDADSVIEIPLSDGGEGFLATLTSRFPEARRQTLEVAGTDTRPVDTPVLWLDDHTVLLESATICGLPAQDMPKRPLEATSYGVGQALRTVVEQGAQHIILGLGGTGIVDGGSGALNGLGMRLTVADGSGLRVGAGDLAACTAVRTGWSTWDSAVVLELLADTNARLAEAIPLFGAQKGVLPGQVKPLVEALATWEQVLCASYPGTTDGSTPGTGAAGGLGFALAVALQGTLVSGAQWVAQRVGLEEAVGSADLVVTGEGRLDTSTLSGKVVSHVVETAKKSARPVAVVVGGAEPAAVAALGLTEDFVVTAPAARSASAAPALTEAARSLALRFSSVH